MKNIYHYILHIALIAYLSFSLADVHAQHPSTRAIESTDFSCPPPQPRPPCVCDEFPVEVLEGCETEARKPATETSATDGGLSSQKVANGLSDIINVTTTIDVHQEGEDQREEEQEGSNDDEESSDESSSMSWECAKNLRSIIKNHRDQGYAKGYSCSLKEDPAEQAIENALNQLQGQRELAIELAAEACDECTTQSFVAIDWLTQGYAAWMKGLLQQFFATLGNRPYTGETTSRDELIQLEDNIQDAIQTAQTCQEALNTLETAAQVVKDAWRIFDFKPPTVDPAQLMSKEEFVSKCHYNNWTGTYGEDSNDANSPYQKVRRRLHDVGIQHSGFTPKPHYFFEDINNVLIPLQEQPHPALDELILQGGHHHLIQAGEAAMWKFLTGPDAPFYFFKNPLYTENNKHNHVFKTLLKEGAELYAAAELSKIMEGKCDKAYNRYLSMRRDPQHVTQTINTTSGPATIADISHVFNMVRAAHAENTHKGGTPFQPTQTTTYALRQSGMAAEMARTGLHTYVAEAVGKMEELQAKYPTLTPAWITSAYTRELYAALGESAGKMASLPQNAKVNISLNSHHGNLFVNGQWSYVNADGETIKKEWFRQLAIGPSVADPTKVVVTTSDQLDKNRRTLAPNMRLASVTHPTERKTLTGKKRLITWDDQGEIALNVALSSLRSPSTHEPSLFNLFDYPTILSEHPIALGLKWMDNALEFNIQDKVILYDDIIAYLNDDGIDVQLLYEYKAWAGHQTQNRRVREWGVSESAPCAEVWNSCANQLDPNHRSNRTPTGGDVSESFKKKQRMIYWGYFLAAASEYVYANMQHDHIPREQAERRKAAQRQHFDDFLRTRLGGKSAEQLTVQDLVDAFPVQDICSYSTSFDQVRYAGLIPELPRLNALGDIVAGQAREAAAISMISNTARVAAMAGGFYLAYVFGGSSSAVPNAVKELLYNVMTFGMPVFMVIDAGLVIIHGRQAYNALMEEKYYNLANHLGVVTGSSVGLYFDMVYFYLGSVALKKCRLARAAEIKASFDPSKTSIKKIYVDPFRERVEILIQGHLDYPTAESIRALGKKYIDLDEWGYIPGFDVYVSSSDGGLERVARSLGLRLKRVRVEKADDLSDIHIYELKDFDSPAWGTRLTPEQPTVPTRQTRAELEGQGTIQPARTADGATPSGGRNIESPRAEISEPSTRTGRDVEAPQRNQARTDGDEPITPGPRDVDGLEDIARGLGQADNPKVQRGTYSDGTPEIIVLGDLDESVAAIIQQHIAQIRLDRPTEKTIYLVGKPGLEKNDFGIKMLKLRELEDGKVRYLLIDDGHGPTGRGGEKPSDTPSDPGPTAGTGPVGRVGQEDGLGSNPAAGRGTAGRNGGQDPQATQGAGTDPLLIPDADNPGIMQRLCNRFHHSPNNTGGTSGSGGGAFTPEANEVFQMLGHQFAQRKVIFGTRTREFSAGMESSRGSIDSPTPSSEKLANIEVAIQKDVDAFVKHFNADEALHRQGILDYAAQVRDQGVLVDQVNIRGNDGSLETSYLIFTSRAKTVVQEIPTNIKPIPEGSHKVEVTQDGNGSIEVQLKSDHLQLGANDPKHSVSAPSNKLFEINHITVRNMRQYSHLRRPVEQQVMYVGPREAQLLSRRLGSSNAADPIPDGAMQASPFPLPGIDIPVIPVSKLPDEYVRLSLLEPDPKSPVRGVHRKIDQEHVLEGTSPVYRNYYRIGTEAVTPLGDNCSINRAYHWATENLRLLAHWEHLPSESRYEYAMNIVNTLKSEALSNQVRSIVEVNLAPGQYPGNIYKEFHVDFQDGQSYSFGIIAAKGKNGHQFIAAHQEHSFRPIIPMSDKTYREYLRWSDRLILAGNDMPPFRFPAVSHNAMKGQKLMKFSPNGFSPKIKKQPDGSYVITRDDIPSLGRQTVGDIESVYQCGQYIPAGDQPTGAVKRLINALVDNPITRFLGRLTGTSPRNADGGEGPPGSRGNRGPSGPKESEQKLFEGGMTEDTSDQQTSGKDAINVYPVPAQDRLFVQSNLPSESIFQVVSAHGQWIRKGTFAEVQEQGISLEGFAPGLYILMVQDQDRMQQKRFVVR